MLAATAAEVPAALCRRADAGAATRALVAGAHAPHVLEGVRQACDRGWVAPALIGPEAGIRKAAEQIGWDLRGAVLLDAADEETIAHRAAAQAPEAGMVIKGQIHTSALLGALLRREAGIRTGQALVHVFHLTHPEFARALTISDGALNVAPDLELRRQIILRLVEMYRALEVERPRIAILAATEEVAPQMPVTEEARALSDWAEDAHLGADVFGPLALDAALAPEAARIKGITSPVAGAADALVVPTIETGNALTKMLAWLRGACPAGVVLGGRIPITVPSRSDPPAARLASVALARIVANAGAG